MVPALLAVLALLVAVAAGLVYWRGRQDDSATKAANRVATIEPVNDAGSPTPEAATPATTEPVVATAVGEVVPPVAPSKTPAPAATATSSASTASNAGTTGRDLAGPAAGGGVNRAPQLTQKATLSGLTWSQLAQRIGPT